MNKELKKKLEEKIANAYYNANGWKFVNASYSFAKIKTMKVEDGIIKVKGIVTHGKDDYGDGCSEKYTDEFELEFNDKLDFIVDVEDDENN